MLLLLLLRLLLPAVVVVVLMMMRRRGPLLLLLLLLPTPTSTSISYPAPPPLPVGTSCSLVNGCLVIGSTDTSRHREAIRRDQGAQEVEVGESRDADGGGRGLQDAPASGASPLLPPALPSSPRTSRGSGFGQGPSGRTRGVRAEDGLVLKSPQRPAQALLVPWRDALARQPHGAHEAVRTPEAGEVAGRGLEPDGGQGGEEIAAGEDAELEEEVGGAGRGRRGGWSGWGGG